MVIAQATHAELYPIGIKLKAVLDPYDGLPSAPVCGHRPEIIF
jgi:hypothetical protein